MTVTQRGTARTMVASAASLSLSATGTWPTGSTQTAKDLLVAVVTAYGNTTVTLPVTATAGWSMQVSAIASTTTYTAVFIKIAAGADTAPTFTATATGTAASCHMTVTLYDFLDSSGATPAVQAIGSTTGTTSPTAPVTGLTIKTGAFAVAVAQVSSGTTSNTSTWTTPAGWTLGADQLTTSTAAAATFFLAAPTAGVTLTCSMAWTHTAATQASAVLLVASPPAATKIASFTDTFWVNDLATNWANSTTGTYAPVIGGGVAQLSTGNTVNEYNTFCTTGLYDLTGSSVFASIIPPLPDALADRNGCFYITNDPGTINWYYGYNGGNLIIWLTENPAAGALVGSAVFDPLNHLWLQVSESAGVLTFWTSPKQINWTVFATYTYRTPVTLMVPMFQAWYSGAETPPAQGFITNISNFNTYTPQSVVSGAQQAVKRAALW